MSTGRERVVTLLPLGEYDTGPRMVDPHRVIADPWGFMLCDPTTNEVVGRPGLWCHRWLGSHWVNDTRRL
jgi:hypothetical protein